eukprot:TRINITY_DN2820_c0_g1_i1.p1 TRINITY_DN2820_c0_g1~~TRINITY_DN2820_c0_g1_i1.p1  ORF type:complete len:329 (+),score=40.33 TRINITY_DN2820_c0_g1_i1:61-1047(+)
MSVYGINTAKYDLLKVLGNGEYGEVIKAHNIKDGHVCALKVIRLGKHHKISKTILREMQSMQVLKHPNITELYSVHCAAYNIILEMEYLDRCLIDILEGFLLKPSQVRGIMEMLLTGLAHMHGLNIIHRDIKPGNLMIDFDGTLKISDFGLARPLAGKGEEMSPAICTRWYRPPESLYGAKIYTTAVDIWSAGAVFAHMLKGEPLVMSQTDIGQAIGVNRVCGTPNKDNVKHIEHFTDRQHLELENFSPIDVSLLLPFKFREATDLLTKMLNVDPEKRPSAKECLKHPYFAIDFKREYFSNDVPIILPKETYKQDICPVDSSFLEMQP